MSVTQDDLILSAIEHPHDSTGILNWMLWHWGRDLKAPLLILTVADDGDAMVNRIRAQLSIARRAIKSQHQQLRMEFGFQHKVFSWESVGGHKYDAVALTPFQSRRHRFKELMSDFLPADQKNITRG